VIVTSADVGAADLATNDGDGVAVLPKAALSAESLRRTVRQILPGAGRTSP
jgi:hypothetical protein